MNILLLHPVTAVGLTRFAEACDRNGWRLTIVTIESSKVADTGATVAEWIKVAALTDDLDQLMPPLAGRSFDAVVAGNEFAVIAAELVAAELGLPHNPIDRLRAHRNKVTMRRLFEAHGVAQPRLLTEFRSLDEVKEFDWENIRFPVITKPVDMAMSLFVRLCHNAAEVEDTVERMFSFHKSTLTNYAFTPTAIVEEFAPGREYSLECIVENGVPLAVFLTTKFVSPLPSRYEIAHLSGDVIPAVHKAAIDSILAGVISAWGVTSSVLHVEFKVDADNARLIEAASRIAGDRIADLVQLKYGVSLEEIYILLRAGKSVAPLVAGRAETQGWFGVKFLFPALEKLSTPAESSIIHSERTGPSSVAAPTSPGGQFATNQRTGLTILHSSDRRLLVEYLSSLGERRT